MPPPLQVDNIVVFIRQVEPVLACWLFKTSATSCQLVDLLTLKVVSDSRVTWATFSLPSPRVMPDVRDRQTDVRQKHRLMPPPYGVEA